MNEIYISITEFEQIRQALNEAQHRCARGDKLRLIKQLEFKLGKLNPDFGLQIIADPLKASGSDAT